MDLQLPACAFHGLMLYAETHYTFRYLGSFLKKREPEILADAPFRIEPNQHLPVLCIIKDAHLFPVELLHVATRVVYPSGHVAKRTFPFHTRVADPFWHTVLDLEPVEYGRITLDVAFCARVKDQERLIRNDNFRTASHAPLSVYASSQSLPNAPGWCFGEPHCHTVYSRDQVEFGAPVAATAHLARAIGLGWMAVTDHSYDLDDTPDDPLGHDPMLPLWYQMKAEVSRENREHPEFVTLVGEETSCGNERGRNVHLLALGTHGFVEGQGDSAERWFRTRPQHSAQEALQRIRQDGGVAFAAHPAEPTPFFQWLLLHRGRWAPTDLANPLLHGMQIWNGTNSSGLETGRTRWIRLLLDGHKKHILGGSDAHGNFNRFRQIGVPFVSIRESDHHLFGSVRTGLFVGDNLIHQAVFDALRRGHSIVTDGPFVGLALKGQPALGTAIGRSFHSGDLVLRVQGMTTDEFGGWDEIVLYQGDLQRKEESIPIRWKGCQLATSFQREVPIAAPTPGYVRAEARTVTGRFCMTNPIWTDGQAHSTVSNAQTEPSSALRPMEDATRNDQ